ncbi:Protein of unknown function DUF1475 [Cynara cardunculus var. scolymus]|uniref:Uncharacterized protein n=1 Tax=Cynara cardunculus var. scolymus TaxID=59895 RepID=A0A118K4A1_CYNCS|nr:Protein of unknown function DUF1475 [Cynara cardunculus var. scolymus]
MATMVASVGIAVKTLMSILACVMAASIAYLLVVNGISTCFAPRDCVATCVYIVLQFYKLSPEESRKDPLYFALARREKGDAMVHRRGPSVVTARIILSALACLLLGTFIYTLIVDGSPFQSKVFTP